MIKRPIVWFGLAYVFGEILENIIGWAALTACAVLFAMIILMNVRFGRTQRRACERKWSFGTRLCLCVLPLFMFCGSLRLWSAKQSADAAWAAGDSTEPVSLACTVKKTEEKEKATYIYAHILEAADCGMNAETDGTGDFLPSDVLVIADKGTQAGYGDKLFVTGQLERFERASNPGCYDVWEANAAFGLYYKLFPVHMEVVSEEGSILAQGLLELKACLISVYGRLLDEKTAGVLCGIMFGDRQKLEPDLKVLYQSQGIGHLFAVSGLHMSMAGVGIYKLLKKMTVPFKYAFALASVFMFAYGFMCGLPLSCVRAIVMAVLFMGAEVSGRSYDRLSALALAALIILWRRPMALTSFGLVMSFTAVWTLVGFLPFLLKKAKEAAVVWPSSAAKVNLLTKMAAAVKSDGSIKLLSNVPEKLVPSVCITLITTPLISLYMYEVPLYSTILNFLLLPLMSLLFPMAAAGGILGLFFEPAGRFFIGIVYYILQLCESVCVFFERLPGSVIVTGRPSVPLMILLSVIIPLLYVSTAKYRGKYILAGFVFLAAEYMLLALPQLPKGARIVFVDVGQGDCAVLSMDDGTNWLIDGGSSSQKNVGKYTIEKVLKFYGIGHLDGVFLSHMDGDHTNGVTELIMSGYEIGELFVPAVCPSEEKLEAIKTLAAGKHIQVRTFGAGESLCGNLAAADGTTDDPEIINSPADNDDGAAAGSEYKGNWRIDCLHPSSDFETDDDNEASMMLLLNIEDFCVLFTGDGETAAEAAAVPGLTDVNLLKAGHHGSRHSTGTDFLEKIKPEAAVISCGADNSYGHPHEEVLERLDSFRCRWFSTARDGAITAKIEHGRFALYRYKTGSR